MTGIAIEHRLVSLGMHMLFNRTRRGLAISAPEVESPIYQWLEAAVRGEF